MEQFKIEQNYRISGSFERCEKCIFLSVEAKHKKRYYKCDCINKKRLSDSDVRLIMICDKFINRVQ